MPLETWERTGKRYCEREPSRCAGWAAGDDEKCEEVEAAKAQEFDERSGGIVSETERLCAVSVVMHPNLIQEGRPPSGTGCKGQRVEKGESVGALGQPEHGCEPGS
jgi:hypothetical protein